MIKLWKKSDWVERGLYFGIPSLVVVILAAAIYGDMAEMNACKDAGGSYEKDGTSIIVMNKVGDVFVPTKVEGYHCVMPEVAVEEVAPVSTMDAYLYGDS